MRKNKNLVWVIDIETVTEIIELAQLHGKNPGDSMQVEFEEILRKKGNKFQLLGETDKDVDMITGELREERKRVLNIKEIDRKKGGQE